MAASHPQPSTARTAAPKAQRLLTLLALLLCCSLAPATQAAAPQRSSFDHLTTGFELLGQHRDLPCESCHTNAIFKGTPKLCASCHGVGTEIRATAKPANHIMSTDQCQACHTPVAWRPAVNFDHTQALGGCSTCHNGVQAQGKPPNHIVTDLECDACHTTLSWSGATFTHQGVTGDCASCHNGVNATGMPANHFPIGAPPTPCESCHSPTNFTTWADGTIAHSAPNIAAMQCATCHETANYLGMHPSTNTTAGDSRPNATLDPNHAKGQLATADCSVCHDTTTFAGAAVKPPNHIPTNAQCVQCHTTPGQNATYSVTGVHQGVTSCLSCHGPGTGPFINVTIVTAPANHIPVGNLDCNGSGCHTTTNVNPGGFKIGTASINTPTLTVAGHSTVSTVVAACGSCHEQGVTFLGMIVGSASAWGDDRPLVYDKFHPLKPAGDCMVCHSTAPTFASNQTAAGTKPAGHIPTTAPCGQCHTTAGNYALYSSPGTHQGVTGCLTCHGSTVNTTFLNVTPVTTPASHIPIGNLDCNGSGCHSTANVTPGGNGFFIAAANVSAPTLTVAGHGTVASAVPACTSCHEQGLTFMGMIVGSSMNAQGDDRPNKYDSAHPTSGDCTGCHTTTPTFASNMTSGSKPANHIPTTAPCAQCHTTPSNYAQYSVTGTHQGVTTCLSCHDPNVAGTFDIAIVTLNKGTHIPPTNPALDCGSSGCHTTANVNPGGFVIGTPNINSPTLTVPGHTTVTGAGIACATCHESATYQGMMASTNAAAGDSRPNTTLDKNHPSTGDCGECHVTTPTFMTNELCGTTSLPACTLALPNNHIPTKGAVCAQCHTTPGNFGVYSVTGVHQGATTCNGCHGPGTGPFAGPPPSNTITIVGFPGSPPHFPIGTADCGNSGCHTTSNVNTGGFKIGNANVSNPTLTPAGHTTISNAGVSGCQGCHQSAQYTGMMVGASMSVMGDDRPTKYDGAHPISGDCNSCHSTTPTFASNQSGSSTKPSNHIPTTAACAQCHTTAGNYTLYSSPGTHQGVTGCLTCHGSTVNTTFANVVPVTTPGNHIPIGGLDCNGSGCHSTANVTPGGNGFRIGAPSVSSPTLTTAGHTTIAGANGVSGCQTCHQSAQYMGMMVGASMSAMGDDRPTKYDGAHPISGECSGCHSTTPTFATNQSGSSTKPSNHIPTNAACAQCHTTAGNYSAYSVTGTHQGVTGCLTCHASNVANTFANVTIVTNPSNHIPFGSLDCNGSGCHTTNNVNPGGFHIGAASLTSPTLTVAGHVTLSGTGGVSGCQTCHQSAQYMGMMVGASMSAMGDDRPTKYDSGHPTSGDCNGCHTTAPTFSTNQNGSSAKPANHIPTNAACSQCHTTAGNYAAYVMGATGHTGITNNCAQCHAYGRSFYNMAPPTLVEPPSGATGHIPAVPPNGTSAIACELCHSPSVFTTFSGTVMKHAYVTALKCMSCHEYNMNWKTNTGVQLWTRPSPNHHAGQDCGGSGCHTSRDKYVVRSPVTRQTTTTATTSKGGAISRAAASTAPAAGVTARTGGNVSRAPASGTPAPALATSPAFAAAPTPASPVAPVPFSHASVTGKACVSCHTAASGSGKPAGHIATSNACQTCHTTLAWLPVMRVNHSQVIGTCVSCHNGTIAKGKPSGHLPTTAACESCHTTTAWTPARFDHAAVVPHACMTCHNSVLAIGKPRTHIPTTQSCDSCHGTLAWTPVKVDHTALTASCASCHNNIGAVGVPPKHLSTQLDCARCHAYPDWSVIHFRHMSAAYPGTHRATLECTSCHTSSTDKVPWPSPGDAGTCGGCHAKDFKPAAHPKTAKGVNYTAHELANCSGACHVYSDTTQSTITRSLPGPHHRVTDATFNR
jgi:hypothetical protein